MDEEGVEGRCQAPNLKKVDEDKEEMDAPYLVHLAHIASEQTKSKGGDGEDGAGNQGGLEERKKGGWGGKGKGG